MPTPGERKALLFLGAVIVLGAGARGAAVLHSDAPPDAAARRALNAQIDAVDSARHRVAASKKGGKKGRGRRTKAAESSAQIEPAGAPPRDEPIVPAIIDIDVATAAEIETLRGIGPALAARIVADRDSLGPFGSTDELQRVRGIGIRLAKKIAPQVTFSLLPRHSRTSNDGTSAPPRRRRESRRGDSRN
jgi:competence ComEA-like helix-hairpin-helix protein